MKLALVVPVMRSGERGGAEALYDGLEGALGRAGHRVDRLEIPLDESSFGAILESYVRCRDLDVGPYDAVISTKAPTYMVRHPRHLSYLLHTIRVFYDRFTAEYGEGTPEQREQRRVIHALDRHGLHPDRVLGHFANGHTPYRRLRRADPFWNDVPFEALHHPPLLDGFRAPRPGRHVFVPGRLHRWKRVDLVIEAFKRVRADIPLKIAGTGEDEGPLRELAAGDPRIEFLGHVDGEALLDLYAEALVVPFVPVDEDYGLVTIEAFASGKPVITCLDSGEPVDIVGDGESGFVVPPTPEAIAAKLDFLIARPELAASMGEHGRRAASHITWERVVERLLAPLAATGLPPALHTSRPDTRTAPIKVLITDNQCIEPAVGGGRLRLLGLYSTLTENIDATYVGTYDWPGPGRRSLALSPRLREIDVPLSDEHFRLNAHLNELVPGKVMIDVAIPWLIASSPDLVETVRSHAAESDVVVFSHPWMYGCLRDDLAGRRVVYDSHNCEARLRQDLLGSTPFGRSLVESVRWIEGELCRRSDVILACSEADRAAFIDLYDVAPEKIVLVPNGVNVETIRPPGDERRAQARAWLGLTAPTALFVGSGYAPNVEALAFIVDRLAPSNPDVTFLVVGGVAEHGAGPAVAGRVGANVKILGTVSDRERDEAYAAADVAINPMFTGSGVNIKMLDFLAAGLPTIATPVGARGILNPGEASFIVDEAERFGRWLRRLREDPELRSRLATNGRTLAETHYDWRRISRELGERLVTLAGGGERREGHAGGRPYFSVVIPTYRRPALLRTLLERLEEQTFRGFEVVVVDQSEEPFDLAQVAPSFHLEYLHTEVPGATRARNLGIARARGRVIAFTDDDCEPDPRWLAHARRYFDDPNVIGVEGFIESDAERSEHVRVVTNVGFEGFGFMTANLFLHRVVIERIGGFDERFDRPHFREDTDLAWRALAYGRIPFGRDVRVLHPAHQVDLARESKAERVRFFVHDPLLFDKHPERYVGLLKAEGHYATEASFWEHFLRGMARHRLRIPFERLAEFMPEEVLLAAREIDLALARTPAAHDTPGAAREPIARER
jgi:glycosyltransferase involved in cell wall biosynthesis/GT2 family glycosyltransferase